MARSFIGMFAPVYIHCIGEVGRINRCRALGEKFASISVGYNYYSNKSRGLRKKADADNQLPAIIAGEMSSKEFRQNWARLIKKSTKWTPGMSKMPGAMRVISVIEDPLIIRKILKHLGLWETRNHDPPPENSSYTAELIYDDSGCQIPVYDDWI